MKVLFALMVVCFSVTLSFSQTKPTGLPAPHVTLPKNKAIEK
jgi:hypothetical protein